ncbi:MAG TPA: hypothetical protein VFW98_03885 [Gemmatimonadaceae bacterium]|nr:hypothetical protein [Gemmatimonadaceae bacterium]
MQAGRWRSAPLGLLILAIGSACFFSKHHTSVRQEDAEVLFYVANNLLAPSPITVQVVSGGTVHLLGSVPAGSHATLAFHPTSITGEYQLQARPGNAGLISSQRFTIVNTAIVSWDVRENTVQVLPRTP